MTKTSVVSSDPGQAAGPTLLLASLTSAVIAVIGVELLSVFGAVGQVSLISLTILSALGFLAAWHARTRPQPSPDAPTTLDRFLLAGLVTVAAITLVVALVSPPNTWDSMTYHSARVAEWYSHGTVAFYPTSIDRQLWQPPFAEYLVLLTYGALGQHDYLANVPQWLAGIGVVVAAMQIAKLLGASRTYQTVAAFLAATTPAIILESTSTQTDLLAALWVAAAAYLALLRYTQPHAAGGVRALWFGAALGLAIGTKGTAILFCLPWVFVFLVPPMRSIQRRALLYDAVLIAAMIAVLNAGQFSRNYSLFREPLGPASMQRLLRPASLEPGAVLSNLITNASLHLGTPSELVNRALATTITSVHASAGLDLKRLYPYFGGFRIVAWSTHEDLAGNLPQFALGAIGLVVVTVRWRRLAPSQRAVAASLGASVLLFAATIRWQPFNSRLHLPGFALLAPCLSLLLQKAGTRWTAIVLAAISVTAIPALLLNQSRPLLTTGATSQSSAARRSILTQSREEQYFANRPQLEVPYTELVDRVRTLGCARVGIRAGYDSWEYPLWALSEGHVWYEHVAVANASSKLARGTPPPCALIGLDQASDWSPERGQLLWRLGAFSLWNSLDR